MSAQQARGRRLRPGPLDVAGLTAAAPAAHHGGAVLFVGWVRDHHQGRAVRGILAISDVVRAYHSALQEDARRMSHVSANAGIADVRVAADSQLAGRRIGDAVLPDGAIVVSIRRGDSVLLGRGSVRLREDDRVTVLARPERMDAVRRLLCPDESGVRRPPAG